MELWARRTVPEPECRQGYHPGAMKQFEDIFRVAGAERAAIVNWFPESFSAHLPWHKPGLVFAASGLRFRSRLTCFVSVVVVLIAGSAAVAPPEPLARFVCHILM
jgi:hypothetical protein